MAVDYKPAANYGTFQVGVVIFEGKRLVVYQTADIHAPVQSLCGSPVLDVELFVVVPLDNRHASML